MEGAKALTLLMVRTQNAVASVSFMLFRGKIRIFSLCFSDKIVFSSKDKGAKCLFNYVVQQQYNTKRVGERHESHRGVNVGKIFVTYFHETVKVDT